MQDIETLGVSRHTDLVTVISMYDADTGVAEVLRFVDMTEEGDIVYRDDFAERVAKFIKILDDAPSLCTFNGFNRHTHLHAHTRTPAPTLARVPGCARRFLSYSPLPRDWCITPRARSGCSPRNHAEPSTVSVSAGSISTSPSCKRSSRSRTPRCKAGY